MAKRTRNGAVDPFITRRVGASHRKNYRHTILPITQRDNSHMAKTISAIGKEARSKEVELASVSGPHSIPAESHYPKSFRVSPKKEGEDA